jgi:glucose-1-phosphate thymidylyltransferase
MNIIIPVAGFGKRLRPHTHTKPKPLLPVAGKPMVDHIMDKVLPLKPTEVWFIVGHLNHRIEEHLRATYPDVKLRFVDQKVLNGTAGATILAREAFSEPVLVDFGDTLFETDLSIIDSIDADGILWAMHREDYQRFGIILTDDDGYMTKIVEKPKERIGTLANIGLHYFKNTKLLAEAIDHVMAHKQEGREGYLTDAVQYMIEHGARIKVLPVDAWFDCGTPEALLEANHALLTTKAKPTMLPGCTIIPPVAIHPTADVQTSTVGPYVSIGPGVIVRGSVVLNSILDTKSEVHNSRLSDSIVGEEAVVLNQSLRAIIGDHSRIE